MKHQVFLECGKIVYFSGGYTNTPARGESIYCTHCKSYRTVTIAPKRFNARCEDCAWKKDGGQEWEGPVKAITTHQKKYPAHRVTLRDGLVNVEIFRAITQKSDDI